MSLTFGINNGEGWAVSPEGGRFAVRKVSNERMRIGSDGSLSFGESEPYWFNTREWAELCKRSMERFDQIEHERKWGASVSTATWDVQYRLTGTGRSMMTFTRFDLENKPILVIDHNRDVIKLDVPAIIYLWLKTTWIPKAWKALMWGEKGKQ